jgi:hypothetical protein
MNPNRNDRPDARGASRICASLGSTLLLLSGCLATTPEVGGGSKTAVTGSAGGATTENVNSILEKCEQSLGTLGVVEDQSATWYQTLQSYKLGSTVPVLRMMIQQSNCFVVVERGAAMQNMQVERSLRDSGEMRQGSNMGAGQMVAADYTMNPSIQFSQATGGGAAGTALAGFGGYLGLVGALAGSMKTNEASTTLVMIDNRSGVQLAAAEGTASNTDFNAFGAMFGSGGGGAVGAYSRTPEGKIIIAAFVDSYNQLVKAVRNYRAQTVKGGLGTGGGLGVQGGSTSASQALTPSTSAAPAAGGTATKSAAPVKSAAPAKPPTTRKPPEPAKQ